jgi:hypothetical protein
VGARGEAVDEGTMMAVTPVPVFLVACALRPCGGCACAHNASSERRIDCNAFRYAQCNTQASGVTPVYFRVAVCQNAATIANATACGGASRNLPHAVSAVSPALDPNTAGYWLALSHGGVKVSHKLWEDSLG